MNSISYYRDNLDQWEASGREDQEMRSNKEDRKALDQKFLYKFIAHIKKCIKKYSITLGGA